MNEQRICICDPKPLPDARQWETNECRLCGLPFDTPEPEQYRTPECECGEATCFGQCGCGMVPEVRP